MAISIADDLHIWRKTYRLTQQECADLVGVSVRTWRRWENRETNPEDGHRETLRYVIARPPYPDWPSYGPADRP